VYLSDGYSGTASGLEVKDLLRAARGVVEVKVELEEAAKVIRLSVVASGNLIVRRGMCSFLLFDVG
jgi:hypothetical protein